MAGKQHNGRPAQPPAAAALGAAAAVLAAGAGATTVRLPCLFLPPPSHCRPFRAQHPLDAGAAAAGAGEGGASGRDGGGNFLLRWRGWQDRVAADPSFPYKVFIEQARVRWEPVTVPVLAFAAKDSVSRQLGARLCWHACFAGSIMIGHSQELQRVESRVCSAAL